MLRPSLSFCYHLPIMLTHFLWWGGDGLALLLLIRGFYIGLLRTFPVFYLYLAYSILEGIFLTSFAWFQPADYVIVSWGMRFLSVTFLYSILWEITRHMFSEYAGARRICRDIILSLFVFVVGRVLLALILDSAWVSGRAIDVIDRDLHVIAGLLFAGIIAVARYYVIPLGRNLMGLTLGYGLFIGIALVALAVRSYVWEEYAIWWDQGIRLASFLCLTVWTFSLWSNHPNPKVSRFVEGEGSYGTVSARTALVVSRAQKFLNRIVDP